MNKKEPTVQDLGKLPESSVRKTLDTFLPEAVKRTLFLGAGMLFMTEEGVRKLLGEINLPREAVNYLVKQSERSKREFFTIFQRELNRFLSRLDLARLSKEVIDGISVEVNATITLRTRGEGDAVSVELGEVKTRQANRKRKTKKNV